MLNTHYALRNMHSDLYLTVDAQRLSGDNAAAYSVSFHWTDQLPTAYLLGNFYLFEIRDDRQFKVLLYQGGWINLIGQPAPL